VLKRWLVRAAAVALLAVPALAAADVAVPPLKAHVTDLTGTLSAPQIRDLESRLGDFERSKGSQVAVLLLPTTQPETIEQYSIRVADAWKIGRARVDDGVILVVAKDDRKLRIEVGRGLEGAIPDAVAKRVVSDVIAPHFRDGDFYGGISAGADALMQLIEGEPLPVPRGQAPPQSVQGDPFQLVVVLVFAAFILGSVFSRLIGRSLGAVATGGIIGALVWVLAGALVAAAVSGFLAFMLVLLSGAFGGLGGGRGGWPGGGFGGGGFGGGGFGGGGFSGGGFSGGGGGFSGGGASGSW
jgi:uncharacterized protein